MLRDLNSIFIKSVRELRLRWFLTTWGLELVWRRMMKTYIHRKHLFAPWTPILRAQVHHLLLLYWSSWVIGETVWLRVFQELSFIFQFWARISHYLILDRNRNYRRFWLNWSRFLFRSELFKMFKVSLKVPQNCCLILIRAF